MSEWQPISSAPKDGTAVLLLSAAYDVEAHGEYEAVHHAPRCAIGCWHPDGTSWVDEHGRVGGDCYTLAVTGVWYPQEGGWFQPNEVTHWMPLPDPPSALPATAGPEHSE